MSRGRPRIAVTLGDPAGIGPEIALKGALDPRVKAACIPVLVGDRRALERHASQCALKLEPAVEILHQESPSMEEFRIGEVHAANGLAAVRALEAAVDAARAGEVRAVVAAPIHEVAIHEAGIAFDGHASFVARRTSTPVDNVYLMLCYGSTRIVHATLHLSVRDAIESITRERVAKAIRACHDALRRMGVRQPRIGVCGLNPHAGEKGLFGREEIEAIGPGIEAARALGILAEGPTGADTLLGQTGYDAFVAMLHDQGHVAAKIAAPRRIVGQVVGAPLLFASVGHGTAMDIAGRGVADPEALIAAILSFAGPR